MQMLRLLHQNILRLHGDIEEARYRLTAALVPSHRWTPQQYTVIWPGRPSDINSKRTSRPCTAPRSVPCDFGKYSPSRAQTFCQHGSYLHLLAGVPPWSQNPGKGPIAHSDGSDSSSIPVAITVVRGVRRAVPRGRREDRRRAAQAAGSVSKYYCSVTMHLVTQER